MSEPESQTVDIEVFIFIVSGVRGITAADVVGGNVHPAGGAASSNRSYETRQKPPHLEQMKKRDDDLLTCFISLFEKLLNS